MPHLFTSTRLLALGLLALAAGCASSAATNEPPADAAGPYVLAANPVQAGEYITTLGGCNDCHTPGWDENGGTTPVEDRMMGSPFGFKGPWGTSYPANLRLSVQGSTSAEWIAMIRGRNTMPPMPWMNLHAMPDRDLDAVYQFLRSLGPKGTPAPAYVPPGQEPITPYFDFTPKNLPAN